MAAQQGRSWQGIRAVTLPRWQRENQRVRASRCAKAYALVWSAHRTACGADRCHPGRELADCRSRYNGVKLHFRLILVGPPGGLGTNSTEHSGSRNARFDCVKSKLSEFIA